MTDVFSDVCPKRKFVITISEINRKLYMNDFLKTITINQWIVTPNNRLSQSLQQSFANKQTSSVFMLPNIMPYESFLTRMYERLLNSEANHSLPALLNHFQFHLLVTETIKQNHPDLYNESLIQSIIESWKRCANWTIEIETKIFSTNHQTRLFCQWVTEIQRRLKNINALAPLQLAGFLKKYCLTLPCKEIIWYGFDDLTPEQQSIQSWLENNACINTIKDIEANTCTIQMYAAHNEQDEQQQWLEWLKRQRRSGKKLGVILPDLSEKAEAIHRLMRRNFQEEEFNISLGRSLAAYPLVAHAMCCLSLSADTRLNSREIKILLHTPFIGEAQSEFHGRTQLLNEQTLMQQRQLTLNSFLRICASHAPLLCKRLRNLKAYPVSASPFEWADHFDTRLQYMGFPGDNSLNSSTYQCYQRLIKALNEFRSLTLVCPQMKQQEAVKQFHNLLQRIVFQPQASATAYIHLTGLLEASGIPYDGLWISGLTDLTLPQAVNYSPFIPVAIQQQHQMPHASFEREYKLAKTMLDRFLRTSKELIASYPKLSGEQPCLPSPFLSGSKIFTSFEITHASPVSMELWEETYCIPLQEKEPLHGGSGILSNQAKCPFRALAAHRLHCEGIIREQDGLEKREQGTFIHQVMEQIWRKLKTQAQLLQLSDSELDKIIHQVCDEVLSPRYTPEIESIDAYTLNIERERLIKLAKNCLELDKQRPPFEVCAIESDNFYTIGSHRLRIKIDRMDQEASGNKWLIDYKSSIPTLPWDKERPEEPQLILYALQDDDIKTISYLQVKSGDVRYKGISHHASDIAGISIPKKNHSWENYQKNWRRALSTLSDEFLQGHCPPAPLRADICNTCEFSSLCRFRMRQMEES